MTRRTAQRASWLLRIGFAAMCAGLALRGLRTDGPVFELLFYDWGLGENAAGAIDGVGGAALAIAGLAILTRWHRPALFWIVAWQLICVAATTARDPYWPWLVPVSDATRWLAPAVLAWWLGRSGATLELRGDRAVDGLRVAAAATFVGHGLVALALRGEFLDFLLIAHVRVTGTPWDQSTAETVLRAIGVVDLIAAGLLLATRSRFVAGWMAAWGAVAAGARIVHSGFGNHPEALLRAPNAFVALAILVAWSDRADRAHRSGAPRDGRPEEASAR